MRASRDAPDITVKHLKAIVKNDDNDTCYASQCLSQAFTSSWGYLIGITSWYFDNESNHSQNPEK